MDPGEFLEVFTAPLEELAEAVLLGEDPRRKTQTALLRAYLMKQRGLL